MRELLDALQPLFAPERPPFLPAPSPSDGLLARYLPLFARLEHQVSEPNRGQSVCRVLPRLTQHLCWHFNRATPTPSRPAPPHGGHRGRQ